MSAASTPTRRASASGGFGAAKRNGVVTQVARPSASANKPTGAESLLAAQPTDIRAIKLRAQQCFDAKDLAQAVKLWATGARKKDAQCLYNLGCCLENGWGVERDPVEAVAKYSEAGRMNHAGALYNLALCSVRGDGMFRDVAKAVALLKQAAQLGHVDANFNAGQLLLSRNSNAPAGKEDPKSGGEGEGSVSAQVAQDLFADALACLQSAADAGHPEAAHCLGLCYMAGGPGMDPDEVRAFECFRRAADYGCVDALYHLGMCYELGQGTRRSVAGLVTSFTQAAALGHSDALFRLGTCFENGIGSTLPQPSLAFKYYHEAALRGHAEAMTHCGICCESGTGTERDVAQAIKWYKRATHIDPSTPENVNGASAIQMRKGGRGPSALGFFRLGRLQFRHELVEASVACLQEEIREDRVHAKAPEPEAAVHTTSFMSAPRATSASSLGLGAVVKPKSKTPVPSPESSPRTDAHKHNPEEGISTPANQGNDGNGQGPLEKSQVAMRAPAAAASSSTPLAKTSVSKRASTKKKGLSRSGTSMRAASAAAAAGIRARHRSPGKVNSIDYLYQTDVDLGSRPFSEMIGEFTGHTILIREMLLESAQGVRRHNLPPAEREKLKLEVPSNETQAVLAKAFELWAADVELDPFNSNALYYLGLCHEVGAGTPVDTGKAIDLYRRASEINPLHSPALFAEAMAMLRPRPKPAQMLEGITADMTSLPSSSRSGTPKAKRSHSLSQASTPASSRRAKNRQGAGKRQTPSQSQTRFQDLRTRINPSEDLSASWAAPTTPMYEHAAKLLWRAWLSHNHTDALFNLGALYENRLVLVENVPPPLEFIDAFGKSVKPRPATPPHGDDDLVPPAHLASANRFGASLAEIAMQALHVDQLAEQEFLALASAGEAISADSVVAQLGKGFTEAGYASTNRRDENRSRARFEDEKYLTESSSDEDDVEDGVRQLDRRARFKLWIPVEDLGKTNLGTAVCCYETAVVFGHKEAMVNLGLCFANGRGVDQDDQEAMRLFSRAANEGDLPAAHFYRGVFLETGRGLDARVGVCDLHAAFECYKRASLLGHHRALHNLGVFYANGLGRPNATEDPAMAVDCFRWAARLGNVNALCDLGVCLKVGRGVERDVANAHEHFAKAAEKGHPDATVLLQMDRVSVEHD